MSVCSDNLYNQSSHSLVAKNYTFVFIIFIKSGIWKWFYSGSYGEYWQELLSLELFVQADSLSQLAINAGCPLATHTMLSMDAWLVGSFCKRINWEWALRDPLCKLKCLFWHNPGSLAELLALHSIGQASQLRPSQV